MKRKTIVITVLLLAFGLAVTGYYLQKGKNRLLSDPYEAVSPETVFLIETIDLQSFFNSITTENGLFGEAARIKELALLTTKIRFIADQLNGPLYKKILTGNSTLISFQISDPGKIGSLLTLALSSDMRLKHIREMVKASGANKINEISLAGSEVLEVPYSVKGRSETVYISVVEGLLLCGSSERIMHKAISQTTLDTDIRTQPGFARVLQSAGKHEDKFFLIFGNLTKILKPVFQEENAALALKAGKLASCSGMDIFISENDLMLSGYIESTSPDQYLNKYKSSEPSLLRTYRILPSSTAIFESFIHPESGTRVTQNEKAAKLAAALSPYLGKEITRAYIDIRERPVVDNSLIIYELNDRVFAEKLFTDEFSKLPDSGDITFFQPDEQIKVAVYKTPYKGFHTAFFSGSENDFDDSWFAFYDRYLITGSSYVTIARLLYDNLLNKTLANDLTFRDFESTLPSVAGYLFYAVPSRITAYLSGWLDEKLTDALITNKSSLEKFQAIGFQFVASNDMLYNSLSLRFREEAREESKTEWETLLDTVAAIKPFFFTNHITGAREIFIQDMKNNAYLINAAGRVLWKAPLRERIISSIYMVDAFKNGKYQLLFSGRNYLHLLDRNGNYVERYPVKLRSPATNPLALFDYDNKRNYRILIAGEDKMVYAYDISGNVLRGWKPFRTNSRVSQEIAWVRVSGKDYLITSDENSVYFTDRTGSKRLSLKEPVNRAANSSVRLVAGSRPSVVFTSSDGTIQHIYFDGSVRKTRLKTFSVDHSFDIFDVSGDGVGEYIFIDQGILYLYGSNGSEMFKREFGSGDLGGPINFIFSASDRKIGVFDSDNNLIYLIDSKGNIMSGFPLRGASMFSIGKLSDRSGWHLIVGGTDRFLYNYKLNTE
ncbi:MAG: hypothetical protein JXR66_05750 [Bacteroidales bacterium]|nr:hypothetical protein [Bacteroidales bacterium]MBN2633037.1 hypothetical protein [Bacteroidales bacterium]